MVVTSVFSKDLECFKNIHPRFSEAFEFLKKAVNEDYKDELEESVIIKKSLL